MANMTDYAATHATFEWSVPAKFNFGVDVVDHWARVRNGPALACADGTGAERRFTYADMAALTARFADALSRQGIGKGDRVLIMTPRIPEWQVAMVGCLKLGAVPIPCIEMLTRKDLAYRIDHASVGAVIARGAQAEKFEGLAENLVRVAIGGAPGWLDFDALVAEGSADFPPVAVAADDPAILYYTSGSTGQPKGVLHASRALYAWRNSATYWLDLTPEDTIWCTADVGWSKAGTSILFGPWSAGACTFFYDGPFEPRLRLELLQRYGVTVYCAPGTELFRIVNEDVAAFDLSRLRHTVTSGEALNTVVGDRWRELTGIQVVEAYGQTETLMTLLNYPCMPVKAGSMGLPAPGIHMAVLDGEGRPLPDGEEGDIALKMPNPQLMLGYWQDEQKTAESLITVDGTQWFITGDRGVRDGEGYFFHRGRRDDVINSAGYRIGPSEVENALLEHPAVQECAAIGAPDSERGEIVKAYIVLKAGFSASDTLVREIQTHVKATTAPYKYPRAIVFTEALPKTMTGKIQRAALRAQEQAALAGGKTDNAA